MLKREFQLYKFDSLAYAKWDGGALGSNPVPLAAIGFCKLENQKVVRMDPLSDWRFVLGASFWQNSECKIAVQVKDHLNGTVDISGEGCS